MADEIPDITVAIPEEVDPETAGDARKATSPPSKMRTTSGTSLTTAPITHGGGEDGGEEEEGGEIEFDFRATTADDMEKSEWGEYEAEEGEGMYFEEDEEGYERNVGEEPVEPAVTQTADTVAKETSETSVVKDVVTSLERKAELAPVSEEAEGEYDSGSAMSKMVKDVAEEVVDAIARRSRMSKLQDVVDSQEPAHSESDDDSADRKGSVVSISRSLSHHLDSIEKEDRGKHPRMPRRKTKSSPAGQKRPSMTLGQSEEKIPPQEPEETAEYPWEGSCSSSSTSTPSLQGGERSSQSALTVEEEEEEEEEEWSRETAVELYKKLTRDKFVLKRKNIVLMKRVNEFFKMKKWEIYTDESSGPEPQQEARYQSYMKQFEEYTKREKEVRDNVNVKLSEMERTRSLAEDEERKSLEGIVSRQREIGVGLISDRTGKPMPNKMLERLIARQVRTLEELKVLRTKYIKIRDAHESKEIELKQLEQLGEGLFLKDYEQLRMENQSYCDKIEERDEELTQLRNRATSSIQILAHIREKANATANSIQELYEELEFTEYEASRNREFVGVLKKERDELRAELKELRDSAGLLVHKRLVEDFERSLALSQRLTAEISGFKTQYADGMVALEKARAGDDWRRSHTATVARLLNTHRARQTIAGGVPPWVAKSKRASSMGRISLAPRLRSKKMKMRMMSESRGSTTSVHSADLAEITKTRPAFFPPIKHSILEYF